MCHAGAVCGRYALSDDLDQIFQDYVQAGGRAEDLRLALAHSDVPWWAPEFEPPPIPWSPRFSIAPTDTVPIVREALDDDGVLHRGVSLARWDLRPDWRTERRPMFNARVESITEKPLFRDAFVHRRALIPMSGYYEWSGSKGDKTPHYFHVQDGEPLAAAGLWESRRVDDGWEISTVILTRPAAGEAAGIHERMPVLLPASTWADWLSPEPVDDAAAFFAPIRVGSDEVAHLLTSHVVDRRVNSNAKVDPTDASLIGPSDVEDPVIPEVRR